MNLAVLASGRGTNFGAIIKAVSTGYIPGTEIKLLITDNPGSPARAMAGRSGITEKYFAPGNYSCRDGLDGDIIKLLEREKIDLIALAGYMRLLSPGFVRKFPYRIMNVHPALLPSFKGVDSIARAYNYGVKFTGVTVHFVDENVDHGPVILQEPVEIKEGDELDRLEEKIHVVEHRLYPLAIKAFAENRIRIDGRRVKII